MELKKELQRLESMNRLLLNSDFQLFLDEIQKLEEFTNTQIEQLTANGVSEKNLADLNDRIYQRNALKVIRQVKDEMVDELEDAVENSSTDAGTLN